jgi:hypothetical protein
MRVQFDRLIDGIDHDKVITQAVHFAESQFHGGRVRATGHAFKFDSSAVPVQRAIDLQLDANSIRIGRVRITVAESGTS